MSFIRLLVGLGNPGSDYAKTRHNAGAWLLEAFAAQNQRTLRPEKKFHALTASLNTDHSTCHLLLPTTFMNESGRAITAFSQFYKIPQQAILVAHDDLDLPAGTVKLKFEGGHGGHNGLRDVIKQLGGQQFHRLRIGIGHPGDREKVLSYVLQKPNKQQEKDIHCAIEQAIAVLPMILEGDMQGAMRILHGPDGDKNGL